MTAEATATRLRHIEEQRSPQTHTVPLIQYSTDGELFSTDDQQAKYIQDAIGLWETASIDGHSVVQVLILDFRGITKLEPRATRDTLVYTLLAQLRLLDLRPVYSLLQNITSYPSNVFSSLVAALDDHDMVVPGRMVEGSSFRLLGNPDKHRKYSGAFNVISQKQGWIGVEEARQRIGIYGSRGAGLLREIHREGLLIKTSDGYRRMYYHSVVPAA